MKEQKEINYVDSRSPEEIEQDNKIESVTTATPLTQEEEKQAMEEMECWRVQNHLKECRKCNPTNKEELFIAKTQGIEEVVQLAENILLESPLLTGHQLLGRIKDAISVENNATHQEQI